MYRIAIIRWKIERNHVSMPSINQSIVSHNVAGVRSRNLLAQHIHLVVYEPAHYYYYVL